MVILKRTRFLSVLLVILLSSTFLIFRLDSALAVNYCVSEKCKAAEAAEAEARKKSEEASQTANTYQEEVKRLSNDISIIESEISRNEAEAEDLSVQITETEQKLQKQQNALAKLIVEMHFETEVDPILVIAGSASISDLAEREAREEVVGEKITASSREIKELKQNLENQKNTVEALLSEAKIKRSEIASAKARQQELVTKYSADASSYLADAEAAAKIKAQEINAAIIASINSSGRGNISYDQNGNSYPFRNICPGYTETAIRNRDGAYGGYKCQCTSYAGWKVYETYGILIGSWGNASNWGNSAVKNGYYYDQNPEVGTVAFNTSWPYGHVMWVEAVSGGTVTISEYNYKYGDFSRRFNVPASSYNYIHFN